MSDDYVGFDRWEIHDKVKTSVEDIYSLKCPLNSRNLFQLSAKIYRFVFMKGSLSWSLVGWQLVKSQRETEALKDPLKLAEFTDIDIYQNYRQDCNYYCQSSTNLIQIEQLES